mgnify:CR=1 FL=1
MTRDIVSPTTDKCQQLQSMLNTYVKATEEQEKELQVKDAHIAALSSQVYEVSLRTAIMAVTICHVSIALHTAAWYLQLQQKLAQSASAVKLVESAADAIDQSVVLDLRQKVVDLEKQCEKLQEERDVLEARIEQRNLQVGLVFAG